MTTEQVLLKFGLSQNEAKVYMALLQIEKGGASVVGGKVGMGRNMARNNCKTLVKKGLAREEKQGNTFLYFAESPEKLLLLLEEQKKSAAQKQAELGKFMGILKAMRNPALLCPDIEYYEGQEGIREIYEDILKVGKDVYCWTNFERKVEVLGESHAADYIKRRLEKGVSVQSIEQEPENAQSRDEARKFEELKCEMSFVKKLPIQNGEVRIYGEKVAIITFNSQKPAGFVLKSKDVSDVFKAIFQSFWELLNQS